MDIIKVDIYVCSCIHKRLIILVNLNSTDRYQQTTSTVQRSVIVIVF